MATIDPTKHLVKFTNMGTATERRSTLRADGPLVVAAGHFFAVVLQRSSPMPGSTVKVTYREVEFMVGEAFVLDDGLLDSHLGWAIEVATRCSQLLADCDAAGLLDWDLRGSIEQIQEQFVRRAKQLPAAQRELTLHDCIKAADSDMPDDWWAKVTARSLVRRDGTNAVLWQFRACMAFALNKADRDTASYTDLVDMLGRAACKDYNTATKGAVAAMVATLMRATRFEAGMHIYIAAAEASAEISRRAQSDAAARFAPLFEARWRDRFPALSDTFAQDCEGSEALDMAASLAAVLGKGSTLTKSVTDATELAAKDALQYLDTQALRGASNSDRLQAVARFHKGGTHSSSQSGADDGAGGSKGESQEQLSELYGDPYFKELARSLEPLVTTPVDTTKVGKLMAASFSPAGLIFLSGKAIPIDPFRKLTAVQSPIVMAAVINNVLAVDKAGLPCPDWGSMCEDKVAVKLFKGQLAVGNSATSIDYWALAKRAVGRREGVHVLQTISMPKKPIDFFLMPELMRLAEAPLLTVMAAIGIVGSKEATYKSYYRWQLAAATAVATLPEINAKEGLRSIAQEVAEAAHADAASSQQLMLKTALDMAARKGTPPATALGTATTTPAEVRFVDVGSTAERKIALFDRLLSRVRDDLELETVNLSRLAPPRAKRGDDDQGQALDTKPKAPVDTWGRNAAKNGIYVCTATSEIVFYRADSKRADVCIPKDKDLAMATFDTWGGCYGQFAPAKKSDKRNTWCHHGRACRDTDDPHKRPVDDEVFDAAWTFEEKIEADIDWSSLELVVRPVMRDGGGSSGGGGGGRGSGSGGGRGDGGGRGGKGGRGGGKGHRGGGGKGGGKGGRHFKRERSDDGGGAHSKRPRNPFQGPRQ